MTSEKEFVQKFLAHHEVLSSRVELGNTLEEKMDYLIHLQAWTNCKLSIGELPIDDAVMSKEKALKIVEALAEEGKLK